jgi:hypothetical protein
LLVIKARSLDVGRMLWAAPQITRQNTLSEALAVLLQTWNRAYYQYHPPGRCPSASRLRYEMLAAI